ncbi:MAG TPA: hypothetical protein VGB46_05190 [Flavisolibacter sp.]
MKQNLRRYVFILLLLPALWLCCKTKDNSSPSLQPGQTSPVNDTLRQLMASWKTDSLGCGDQRNKEAAESLLQGMKLENGSMKDFTEVFGTPNRQDEHDGATILRYYFDAACIGGRVTEESDYCSAEFTFREGRLAERQYICL